MWMNGRVVSVNWPLWTSGGMNIDDEGISYMKQELGLDHIGRLSRRLPMWMKTRQVIQLSFFWFLPPATTCHFQNKVMLNGCLLLQKSSSALYMEYFTVPAYSVTPVQHHFVLKHQIGYIQLLNLNFLNIRSFSPALQLISQCRRTPWLFYLKKDKRRNWSSHRFESLWHVVVITAAYWSKQALAKA
jgi:hypothetical protein